MKRIIPIFLLIFYSSSIFSEDSTKPNETQEKLMVIGDLYAPQNENPPKNKVYTFKRFESGPKDTKTVRRVYENLKGEVVATEIAYYENGKVRRLELDHKQINDTGSVEVKDGKLFFSYTEYGETKTDSEKLRAHFITSDDFVPFVETHWDELLSGKEFSMRYPVLSRKETIGFDLEKSKELSWKGKPAIEFKMSASSFFVSALVDPLYLTFDKETKKLVKMVGRTVPREFKNGKWVDWDALILYRSP